MQVWCKREGNINEKGILKTCHIRIYEHFFCCVFLPLHRHRDGFSLHIQCPRIQHPAAHRYTQQDHQSHPGIKDIYERVVSQLIASWILPVTAEIHTWQESLPPSRYPAQNMDSVIMPGYALSQSSSDRMGIFTHCSLLLSAAVQLQRHEDKWRMDKCRVNNRNPVWR